MSPVPIPIFMGTAAANALAMFYLLSSAPAVAFIFAAIGVVAELTKAAAASADARNVQRYSGLIKMAIVVSTTMSAMAALAVLTLPGSESDMGGPLLIAHVGLAVVIVALQVVSIAGPVKRLRDMPNTTNQPAPVRRPTTIVRGGMAIAPAAPQQTPVVIPPPVEEPKPVVEEPKPAPPPAPDAARTNRLREWIDERTRNANVTS